MDDIITGGIVNKIKNKKKITDETLGYFKKQENFLKNTSIEKYYKNMYTFLFNYNKTLYKN
jgi:hypothetical protein